MVLVVLQGHVPGGEEIQVALSRVPVAGDQLEFGEEYAEDSLAGESFEVRRVIFCVTEIHAPEPPIVVLRAC